MAQRLTFSGEQYWNTTDRNGEPGAKLYTYEAGTTTPKTTWNSADESTPNLNPVVADAEGIFPAIYGDGSYFIEIYNQDDTDLIYQEDNITSDPDGDDSSSIERIPDLDTAKGRDLTEFDVVYVESLTANWENTIAGPNAGFYAHSDGTTGTPSTGDENQFFDSAGNGFTRDGTQRIDESIIEDIESDISDLQTDILAATVPFDRGGFVVSYASVAENNITSGKCSDSSSSRILTGSAETINLNSTIGGGGNRPSAVSLANDTWYHIFIVTEADGSNYRYAYDTSETAVNALAAWSTETGNSYTLYRGLRSVKTNGSSEIIEDFEIGDKIYRSGKNTQLSTSTSTSPLAITLETPTDIRTQAVLSVDSNATAGGGSGNTCTLQVRDVNSSGIFRNVHAIRSPSSGAGGSNDNVTDFWCIASNTSEITIQWTTNTNLTTSIRQVYYINPWYFQ